MLTKDKQDRKDEKIMTKKEMLNEMFNGKNTTCNASKGTLESWYAEFKRIVKGEVQLKGDIKKWLSFCAYYIGAK